MSRKRRNTSSPESEELTPPRRRSLDIYQNLKDDDLVTTGDEQPAVDSHSGQLGAFPGLGNNDELYYGPASNGIEYLRMVRSEAKGVPRLLVSEPRNYELRTAKYDALNSGDAGGYYFDGAYTGLSNTYVESSTQQPPFQLQYYDSLLTQFRLVQATMRCIPPVADVQKLDSLRTVSFPTGSRKAREHWYNFIQQNDPHPVQIACMDQGSTMSLLDLIRRRLMILLKVKSHGSVRRLGSWIWATLGKCRDCGELGSDEIGELRALAQKAVEIIQRQGQHQNASFHLQVVQNGTLLEDSTGKRSQTEELYNQRRGDYDKEDLSPDEDFLQEEEGSMADQILIILEMIITVVGEVYGQRDLLAFRETWETAEWYTVNLPQLIVPFHGVDSPISQNLADYPQFKELATLLLIASTMSGYDPSISNGTCYYADGEQAPARYIPCGNEAGGHVACCESADMCLSSHACFNGQYYVTYLAGCTDPNYEDTSCPDKGSYWEHIWAGLVYCNGTSNEWVACPDYDTTVSNPDLCWCPSTSRTVAFTDASILTNIMSLPRNVGDKVEWQDGFGPGPSTLASTTVVQASSTALETINSGSSTLKTTASQTSAVSIASKTFSPSSTSMKPAAASSTQASHTLNTKAKIGISLGAAAGAIACMMVLVWRILRYRSRRRKAISPEARSNTNSSLEHEYKSPTITGDAEMRSPAWSGHKSELPADESVTVSSSPTFHGSSNDTNVMASILAGRPISGNTTSFPWEDNSSGIPATRKDVYELPG